MIPFLLQDELETLRTRLEKVEKERTEFKQTNEKLESRVCIFLSVAIYICSILCQYPKEYYNCTQQKYSIYFNDSISNTNERFCKCYILRIHVSIMSYKKIRLFSVCSVYLLLDGAVAIHQSTSLECKKECAAII